MSQEKTQDPTQSEKGAPIYKENIDVNHAYEIGLESEETRPSAWTFRMFRLYAVLLLIYLCAALNGYDSSLMPAINGMSRL